MATLALSILGGAAGVLFGGPSGGYLGAKIGFSVGALLGGLIDAPSTPPQETGRLSDLKVTSSGYGIMIPQVWGRYKLAGNIIWSTDLIEHIEDTEQGGKGFGGQTVRKYSYSVSFASAICEGPITSIQKIWADDLLIYDSANSPATKYNMTFYYGTSSQLPSSVIENDKGAGNVPGFRGTAYVVFEDLPLDLWGSRMPNMQYEITKGSPTIQTILEDLSIQVGLTSSEYNYGQATDSIIGYVSNQRKAAKDTMADVLRVYQVDLAEYDGSINAIKRGGAIEATITDDSLGVHDYAATEATNKLKTQRVQELELSGQLDLLFFSIDDKFQQSTQTAIRYSKYLIQDASAVATGLVLGEDFARQSAEMLLYTQWLERTSFNFNIDYGFLYLVPGSPINLEVNGVLTRCRITSMDIAMFGYISVAAVLDDPNVLTQIVSGGRNDGLPTVSVLTVVPTVFDAWSGPDLRVEDGLNPGFYVAATGGTGWGGCTIFYSSNGGTDWTNGGTIFDKSDFGTATSALANWTVPDTYDTTNSVNVVLNSPGSISNTSSSDVDHGNNAALLGGEVIGFVSANLTSPLHYTLSNIKRGQLSTPMTGHTNGERFVHLTKSIARVKVPTTLVGTTVLVKCVSPGESIGSVTAISVVIAAPTPAFATSGDIVSATQWQLELVLASTNFTVPNTPTISYGIVAMGSNTITLPNVATHLRPIFIRAEGGSVTVAAASGQYVRAPANASIPMRNAVNVTQSIILQGYGGINTENTGRRCVVLLPRAVDSTWYIIGDTFAG